jgi:adenylate cyclase
MTCAACQAPNPPSARYCQQCGARFGPPCAACGAATWPNARYCNECGTAVGQAASAAAGGAPAGAALGGALGVLPEERRLVTVLFADVVGFTSLSERLDPEEVRDLMLSTFRELARLVRQHGGRIEKYIGDALLGLFGAPVAREDDVERALHSALALHAEVERLSADVALQAGHEGDHRERPALRLRVGVNTGLAVVGTVGDETEYGVMGDTVNTAARLQTAADPGATLVGEATWRVAQRHFAFDGPRLLELKGKAAPVLGYGLRGPRGAVAPEEILGPLFGREREVAALDGWLTAVASGQGRVAAIVGETGMGKSRLLAEAHARAESLGLLWVATHGQPHRQHVPGGVFDEAARAVVESAGLSMGGDPATIEARARDWLTDLGAIEALPFLRKRLGLPSDPRLETEFAALTPAARTARIAGAIERLWARLAARGPLVLAIDDAHWADPYSLAVQERLIALVERVPLGLLFTMRPDADGGGARLREQAGHQVPHRYTELLLGPLSRDASKRLVKRLLGGDELSAAATGLVLDRAEGNPLFLEEVARSLVESGTLVRGDAGWTPGHSHESDIPTTLHATLLARLDRLAEPTRHLLQAASVVGRQFALPVVAELVDPTVDVEAALLEAQRTGLVEAVGGGLERRYQFRHGLLQEVAYSTLLLRRRRELHAAVAVALRAATDDPELIPWETLADHYAHAEQWPQAQAAAVSAAERAERLHAYHEAATHWQMAWQASEAQSDAVPPGERAGYAERQGNALSQLGEYDQARGAYETALAAWMQEPPAARQVARSRLHVNLARLALAVGDSKRAAEALAVAMPGLRPEQPELSTALSLEAQVCFQQGQLASAATHARRALELALAVGGPREQCEAYAALTNPGLLGVIGEEGRAYSHDWVELARAQGDPSELVRALLAHVATHLFLQGLADAAVQTDAEEALALARELHAPALVRTARAHLGVTYYLRGDWQQAATELASGVGSRPEESGIQADLTRYWLGSLHTGRGELAVGRGWFEEGLARTRFAHAPIWLNAGLALNLRLAGDVAGARAALERGARILAEVHCRACGVLFEAAAAEHYAAAGEAAAARTAAARSIALGQTLHRSPSRLAGHRALATVALAEGDIAAALVEITAALRLSQRLENPYEHARTELLAARVRLARGTRHDRTLARGQLGRALAVFDRLAAAPELEACRGLLAGLDTPRPRRLGAAPAPPVTTPTRRVAEG